MNDFGDKLYENDGILIKEILKYTGLKYWSGPSYCVCLDNEIIINTGSDIMDADNVCTFLRGKYPGLKFNISNEHISISNE